MKITDALIPLLRIELSEEVDEESPDGGVISQNSLGTVLPAALIKRRRKLIKPYKDQRKASAAKSGWRKARYNHLKGIRAFAKSVEGKRFHRNLGNFIANREPREKLSRYESADFLSLLASYRTHALIDLQYYKPLHEEVTFFNAIEEFIDIIDSYTKDILESIFCYEDYEVTEDFYDMLIRILESSSIIKSFAQQTGKSEAEVEALWDKAKGIVSDEYGKSEDDEGYYAIVVGILKNMLGIKSKE